MKSIKNVIWYNLYSKTSNKFKHKRYYDKCMKQTHIKVYSTVRSIKDTFYRNNII